MAALLLLGTLSVAAAGGLYDLPYYTGGGVNSSLTTYKGNVTLVVNTAHL